MPQVSIHSPALFETVEIFDDDYLYFYNQFLSEERTKREVETITTLLSLKPKQSVLDIGCGHGRISNAMAERGLDVTGIDISARFLELAREDARSKGLSVEYRQCDMRSLPESTMFDAAYIWFTTFGYFDDADNQTVLSEAARVLKPGGRLLLEQVNRVAVLTRGVPHWDVCEVADDLMIDKVDYDGLQDRAVTVRTIVRDGQVRKAKLSVRLYSPVELRTQLINVGFSRIEIFGQGGKPFDPCGNRLIALATK